MPQNIFGTDGVRGVANADLSCDLAFRLGRAATKFLGPDICIGRDTRLSGTMLESALTAGIMAEGGRPHCCGVIPTPAVALLTVQNELDGGIVISASHNPPELPGLMAASIWTALVTISLLLSSVTVTGRFRAETMPVVAVSS